MTTAVSGHLSILRSGCKRLPEIRGFAGVAIILGTPSGWWQLVISRYFATFAIPSSDIRMGVGPYIGMYSYLRFWGFS